MTPIFNVSDDDVVVCASYWCNWFTRDGQFQMMWCPNLMDVDDTEDCVDVNDRP